MEVTWGLFRMELTVKIGALGVLGLFMVLESFLSYLPHILFDKRLRFNGILLAVKSAIYSLKNLLLKV